VRLTANVCSKNKDFVIIIAGLRTDKSANGAEKSK
jgi:hypothetical protein